MENGQRIDQRIQDLVNLEQPIQDYLGWVLGLDQKEFNEVLEQAGHLSPNYHAEKWAEFERDKLTFLWNWTPKFFAAWSVLK